MLHSTVAATPEHPEGRRQNIRIDGFVPDAEELYDPDPECLMQNVEVHNVSMHVPTLTGEMQVMKITPNHVLVYTMKTLDLESRPAPPVKNLIIDKSNFDRTFCSNTGGIVIKRSQVTWCTNQNLQTKTWPRRTRTWFFDDKPAHLSPSIGKHACAHTLITSV